MSAPASGEPEAGVAVPPDATPEVREAAPEAPAAKPRSRAGLVRLGILFALLVATYAVGRVTGVTDSVDVEAVRVAIRDAGAFGVVAYIVIFAVGELLHVPGIVFVAAGLLVWGDVVGLGLSFLGSMCSVSLSFVVVRAVGGKVFAAIERPFVKRILARLDARPIRTVAVLRMILFLAPPLNYGLALTQIRFRDYFVGSAIGLAPPIIVITLVLDWVLSLL